MPANIKGQQRFVRAPEVSATIDSAGVVTARARGGSVKLRSAGLRLLDAFGKPTTVAEAIARLPSASARDFIDMTSAIGDLIDAGIVSDADGPALLPLTAGGWDGTDVHVRMLRDEGRTTAFQRAIQEVVRPGDVVVDIGTGTGVLAAFAARAGARKVYAIEASSIGALAEENFRRNGLDDRIELVRGWSTQVVLPERADVLLTETIGNEPLGERIVDTVFDARTRLLVAEPRLVPATVRVVGTLVEVPEELAARHLFTNANLERMHARYGLDLSAMQDAERRSTASLRLDIADARKLRPLSEPFSLADVELLTCPLVFSHASETTATSPGSWRGVLLHFETQLGPTTHFDLALSKTDDSTSWSYMLWFIAEREVAAGERIALRYDYADGDARLTVSD
jgi:protein arginine N-methyltransferase 1